MKKSWVACGLALVLAVMPGAAAVSAADFNAGSVSESQAENSMEDWCQENTENSYEAVMPGDIENPYEAVMPGDIENPDGAGMPGDIENPDDAGMSGIIENPDDTEISGDIENPDEPEFQAEPDIFTSGDEPEEELFGDASDADLFSSAGAASESASFITSCTGYSEGQIRVTAKVPYKVKSKDVYYYLFRVNPVNNKLSKQAARLKKPAGENKNITFKLNTAGHPEYVMSKFALAVKTKAGSGISAYTRISGASYVASPERTASNTSAYAVPKSKKGLQTTNINELTETKCKTAFLNLPVSILLVNNAERVSYKYNGKTYYFNKIGGYTQFVSQCNQKGIQVTMQILLDYNSSTKSLTASGSQGLRSSYYAWNTTNAASREKMEALFSFISELFGSQNCYVSNWILGNEVNTYSVWHYPGNMSKAKYIENYSETFRCLYNAVRSRKASSKVFICLDHYWNLSVQGYSAKDMMDSFASKLKTIQSGVNWNLAYHAYPYPLTDPRFWSGNNSNYLTNNSNSPVISLNNLSVLTNYVKKNYGTGTRVILSEQGFTSTKGQDVQAAALALGYYIAACNPMVDAFHIRSYQDASHEVAQGLAMGIKGKKAFKVFVNMDSSKTLNYTKSYLTKQVGSKWSSKVPGYSKKRLYTMYRSE
ncbi:DUF5722 domain-containing protein [Blautia schinkii]|nr:DUF5722 domain-containing protein [Blautia schinkii]